MLTAYFDDSGTHTSSDLVLWCGLFGNEHQWKLFDELWAKILADPCPGKPPLKRFHMTECQNSLGEFAGWKRVETDYLVHELGGVIIKAGLYSDGLAVARKDYDEIMTEPIKRAFGDPEGYCLRMCYVRSLRWARKYSTDDQIRYVFDRRPQRENENKRIFDVFRRYGENEQLPPNLDGVEFLSSYEHLPLQAADLLAWEVYQHGLAVLKNKNLRRPARKQLSRLMKGRRINMGIAGPDVVRRIALQLKNVDPTQMLAVADHMTV
jgi:hypothetical protein